MAAFPTDPQPSYSASKSSSPKIRITQFGDGYQDRTQFGLNQNPKTWTFNFKNITESEADTIETFLDASAVDQEAFDYTPVGESSSSKFICKSWNKVIDLPNRATINVTFEEVFEP